MIVKFKQYKCAVARAQYGNGRVALRLIDADTGEPVATATVNMPDDECGEDEAHIKDWSENEGMVEALTEAGIIGEQVGHVESGYVRVPLFKLLTVGIPATPEKQ